MSTLLASLDSATDHFRRHLAAIKDDQWTAPTPCGEWDVHYLSAHVVGGNRFASLILDGRSAQEAMDAVMGTPQLGSDPLASFDESAVAQRAAFGRRGALTTLVSHPMGEVTGERFLAMRVFDVTLHAWDLATAIGRDAGLDDPLVDLVLDIIRAEVPGMGFGIERCGDAGPDATGVELLLDLSGRCAQPVVP